MVVSVDLEQKTECWNLGATVKALHVASTNYMSLGHTEVNIACVNICKVRIVCLVCYILLPHSCKTSTM